tara:strand:+ start:1229 stop:2215 length:987 start_codon:yes stop_codon:yes gene_type:complete
MSEYLTKYFNSITLNEATSVYDDSLLTVVSANGYYSDGTVTRYQTDGVLGLNLICTTCVSYPCTSGITISMVNVGRFDLKTTFGSAIGAIKVTIPNVTLEPVGIQLLKDSIPYDVKFSSTNSVSSGEISAPIVNELSLFSSGSTPVCSDYNFSSISLPTYAYDGSDWVTDNVLSTIPLLNKRAAYWYTELDDLILYIPKTSTTDFTLNTIVLSICGSDAQATPISIGCPVVLPSVPVSNIEQNSANACQNNDYEFTYYVGYVSGSTVGGDTRISVNDFIFNDENGEVKRADGFYGVAKTNLYGGTNPSYPYGFIQVENGVVIQIGSCT